MLKYVCQSCGESWFTANTSEKQKCPDCGGLLKICSMEEYIQEKEEQIKE